MGKVYVVFRKLFNKAYHAEPFESEEVAKVFDDYHKVVSYICDAIKEDHKRIDDRYDDLSNFHKYTLNPDNLVEGWYISSFDYSTDNHYNKVSYRFHSYDVE